MGVIGLMLNLRNEAAESGVGVTVLCPGGVTTSMVNSPSYRPARFGGPSNAKVKRPEGFFQQAALEFRPPEQVAQIVLRAVRENRPMVLTDASMRKTFVETYVNVVMEAFDQVEAFDRETARARG
jgi:short-subunit dehydrogenase